MDPNTAVSDSDPNNTVDSGDSSNLSDPILPIRRTNDLSSVSEAGNEPAVLPAVGEEEQPTTYNVVCCSPITL